MTLLGQSRQEAQRPIGPIVAPKKQTTIWNVEELECGQGSGAKQRVLGKERDGLMRLLAQREMMMN